MQVAHPLVAAGVATYSDFREHPLRRMRRTLDLTLRLVYGTRREAIAAAREINRTHRAVRGTLEEDASPLSRGALYRAGDPQLLLWVHATLVYTTIATYQSFVRQLTEDEKEAYYRDMKLAGRLFGIPAAFFAEDLNGFEDYLRGMIEQGPVIVSGHSRVLARHVLRPTLRFVHPALYEPFKVITAGLLPAPLRERYGLSWGPVQRCFFRLCQMLLPALNGRMPSTLRVVPQARVAACRLSVIGQATPEW